METKEHMNMETKEHMNIETKDYRNKETTQPLVFLLLGFFVLLFFCFSVFPAFAQDSLVPCNTNWNEVAKEFNDPCGFNELMVMINKIIDFILFKLAIPLAAILFAYGGFLFLTSGGSGEKIQKAKKIFWNVLIGFVIALAAWLIVKAIFWGLGAQEFSLLEK